MPAFCSWFGTVRLKLWPLLLTHQRATPANATPPTQNSRRESIDIERHVGGACRPPLDALRGRGRCSGSTRGLGRNAVVPSRGGVGRATTMAARTQRSTLHDG